MSKMTYGNMGKVLHLDMTSKSFEIEELSMAEVARSVGCPLFTAYARLYAARREVRKAVEKLTSGNGQTGRNQP